MAMRRTGSAAGSETFGYRPQPLSLPTPQADLRAATPNYDQLLADLTGNIMANLGGVVPGDVNQFVADQANARAYAGGYGGSGLGRNLTLRDLGLTSLQRQDVGAGQLMNFLPIQSRTATLDPALQTQINEFNSLAASSADPAKYAQYAQDREDQRFQEYMDFLEGQQGGGRVSGAIPSGGVTYGGSSAPSSVAGYGGYTPIPFNPGAPAFGVSGTRTSPLTGWTTGTIPFSYGGTPTSNQSIIGPNTYGGVPQAALGQIGSRVDQILAGNGITGIV